MKKWVRVVRIAIPLVLFTAAWMIADGHRTPAIVSILAGIAGQLAVATEGQQ